MVNIESRNCITIASERLKEFAAAYDLIDEKLKVPDKVFYRHNGNAKRLFTGTI